MEIFEVLPIVSFRGISTGIPIFGPEIDQKVGKIAANCCTPHFLLCSGGDLNPHALRHTPLKRTCLPFHHPSDAEERNLYHGRWVPQVFLQQRARSGAPPEA